MISEACRMPGRIDGLILRSSPSARGVWFVDWSKTVGGDALWWAGCGCGAGCVGAVGDWETVDVDKWGQGYVVSDGRDGRWRRRTVRSWRISTRKPKRARRFAKRRPGRTRPG